MYVQRSCSISYLSIGPQPVGVQRPLTSSLGEFPDYWDWHWYPGLTTFSFRLPYRGVFPFTLLHLPLDFIRISIPVVPNLFWPGATFILLEDVGGHKEIFKLSRYNIHER